MSETTDLRVYKTRKALCEAFMELISKKPFDSITINELCEKALVRRATFYSHFIDKYDFFSFFIRFYRNELMGDGPVATDTTTLSEYCIYYFDKFLNFVNENRTLIDNILKSNMLSVILDIFSEETYTHILEITRKSNILADNNDLSAEMFASFYTGGIIEILKHWIQSPTPMDESVLKKNVATLLTAFSSIHS